MRKIIFFYVICMFSQISILKAQLQPGECGIMFTYDASGSLVQRVFICNNTGGVIYRITNLGNSSDSGKTNISGEGPKTKEEIVKVNALMANPTSGKFTVRLARTLKNQNVLIMDINGKVLQNRKQSGFELNFDISSFSAGIYFVKIESNGNTISLKVIKQ